ncbi:MAG: sulfurtransferase TusA family protein [Candidatus Altiarchaeota archaeon]|nr:sulfurtransferase TusA family protein [Candidatus Altiarchaeota archaeon]
MVISKEFGFQGQICPYPMVNTMKTIKEYYEKMKSGEIADEEVRLAFLVDHMPAVDSVPEEIEKRGHGFRVMKAKGKSLWRIDIQLLKSKMEGD